MKENKKIFKLCGISSNGLYINNLVHGHYFTDKCLLYFKIFIHLFIAFFIGGLESVYLDAIQIVIVLFIFSLLIYLNFQLFHYYSKEKNGRIVKKKLALKKKSFYTLSIQ